MSQGFGTPPPSAQSGGGGTVVVTAADDDPPNPADYPDGTLWIRKAS